MRVLITGFTGFAGSHLAEHLLERGDCEIFALYRWRSRMDNVSHILNRVELIEGDLMDAAAMHRAVDIAKPDWIFHLGAQSFVPTSWTSPGATCEANIQGQINLFEAVRAHGLDPRIQIACSSEEYGLVHPDELPIRESNPLRPLSPYAVSKVAQDMLGYQYHASYGMQILRTRGFNHTGPRRGQVFVCSNFAHQVASIEAGLREPIIRVGNLDAKRDFTDVRDMVRAYVLAVEKGEAGKAYNICTGNSWEISKVLDMLIAMAGVEVKIEEDESRMRPSDVPILEGSAAPFQADTGWKAEIPFEKTMEDLLNYWRRSLAQTSRASA